MEANSWVERLGQWPSQTKNYIDDLRQEMRRVTWPSWKQVRATTIVVIGLVFVFAAYFAVVDYLIANGITKVFEYFTK